LFLSKLNDLFKCGSLIAGADGVGAFVCGRCSIEKLLAHVRTRLPLCQHSRFNLPAKLRCPLTRCALSPAIGFHAFQRLGFDKGGEFFGGFLPRRLVDWISDLFRHADDVVSGHTSLINVVAANRMGRSVMCSLIASTPGRYRRA
jgi:hypothetical protein